MAIPELVDGRYELGPVIGRGAMGLVHEASDLRLGRPVAIKLLRADLADQPEARQRFEEEARSAARLGDHRVVAVFDFGEADGVPYIVMERLPGRTLSDELRAGPMTERRAQEVGVAILGALQAAHQAGVVHRDIKPGNVLLTNEAYPKVADFGIAKAADYADSTSTGMVLGTPAYLAPERLSGQPASPSTDVYAVGVLLYECLAGERPYVGDTPFAVTNAIMTQSPTPLASIRPDVSPPTIAAIEWAMAKDPARRPHSAAELRDALTGKGRPRRAARPAADATTAMATTTAMPSAGRGGGSTVMRTGRPPAGARRLQPVLALLAILLLLGCIAVGIAIAERPSTSLTRNGPTVSGPLGTAIDNLQRGVQP